MHDAKFTPKNSDLTTSDAKKFSVAREHVGVIDTPYGTQLINRGEAVDHAHMRGRQLSSLLLLIQGDNAEGFRGLGPGTQDSLLWLAVQLADEMQDMIDIIDADARKGSV